MPNPIVLLPLAGALLLGISACGEMATLPEDAGFGPRPAGRPARRRWLRRGWR
jgi:hypothetical protein